MEWKSVEFIFFSFHHHVSHLTENLQFFWQLIKDFFCFQSRQTPKHVKCAHDLNLNMSKRFLNVFYYISTTNILFMHTFIVATVLLWYLSYIQLNGLVWNWTVTCEGPADLSCSLITLILFTLKFWQSQKSRDSLILVTNPNLQLFLVYNI